MEGRTVSKLAVKPDAATLHFNQTLGDIQTKTRAWYLTRFHIIGAKEFLEDF